jgi:hypothetical protein
VDTDADGLYDPTQGDYPNINGPDQGIWWIFNDAGVFILAHKVII